MEVHTCTNIMYVDTFCAIRPGNLTYCTPFLKNIETQHIRHIWLFLQSNRGPSLVVRTNSLGQKVVMNTDHKFYRSSFTFLSFTFLLKVQIIFFAFVCQL
jgi:hypothetical protein